MQPEEAPRQLGTGLRLTHTPPHSLQLSPAEKVPGAEKRAGGSSLLWSTLGSESSSARQAALAKGPRGGVLTPQRTLPLLWGKKLDEEYQFSVSQR